MAQLFSPRADRRLRWIAASILLGIVVLGAFGFYHARSAGHWNIGEPRAQPIAFPHDVHAGGLGIDCTFCHSTVERAADAGMPDKETCLTCHSQIWRGVPALAPLHSERPIIWKSVSALPHFARFDHAAHLRADVDCATCHGDVAAMRQTAKAETLSMGFCLDCHRRKGRGDDGRDLTDCSVCHY